ncbi:MAG: C40 family peptidase [Epsilonproteobacteria bacterium]|nr:C40 family peptidase [Campylobacterota bacterium]
MGIKEPKSNKSMFIVTEDSTDSYNFITTNHPKYNNISSDIEVVSYGSYRPDSVINSQELINNIELNAKSFLGTKYVWGATGPSQFDCSGFTQWVYRDAGIHIPRVSRDQAKVGQYVSYQNLRRGDMVFFDTKKHKKGVVTHVGIYLGNGNFIHASSAAKKVVVYNFNEKPFYKKRFLWGRRVVQDNTMYASN